MSNTITPNNPPYPAFRATNKESFAYETTIRRWPIIIDSAIKDVKQTIAETFAERAQEGASIVAALEAIKQELVDEKPLRPIQDNKPDTAKWNRHLEDYFKGCTWMNGTWLFNECYLYRRMAEIFYNSQHWTDYDCFERQKNDTFKGSYGAVFDLACKMPELIKPMPEEKLEIVYNELIQICLWGNATDLSLLTNMSQADIERLQAVEKDHLATRRRFILVDDTEKLWQKLKSLKGGRVDFVLDNSGFEVFVDMIFADWLLQSGLAGKVVFNCKTMPWFVSDVMPKDMPMMFKNCLDRDFFPAKDVRSQEDVDALETMVHRWEQYVADGKLVVRSHDFWCTGLSYWYMESDAPDLFSEMKQSDVVLYKGDLNYRKLVFDCDFPVTTPFKEAIGPSMANRFTNIIALRTNKADPVVGLTEETKKDIEGRATRQEWRFSGKYAVVEYN
ncbi:AB hydrolase-1 domain-containing protein [Mucor velutinosus]|uniref:Sugar phosphate phosphatase n=1 Tax=Mucor velutinosus TaxID=708070 RepID=A0AAN7DDE1_9FUNG|nr:AB hydrolase-1 domain-containing protein [Mucor velutinosus]